MVDIHNYDGQYDAWERYVRESAISQRNKDLIFAYRDACVLHGVCGKVRLIRAFQILGRAAGILGKDFDAVNRKDIEQLIATLMNGKRKPATIATYKAIIKRFMGFVLRPDEFPQLVQQPSEIAWLTVRVKKRDEPRLQRTELLTPDDVQALLRVSRSPRDKAFISILWETGSRVSEIGNLQLKHITDHDHGFVLDLDGKTGRRSPLVVSSSPHLATWLSHHPFRNDPESPLWVHYQHRDCARAIDYDTIRTMLKRHFQRAGITKPFHPHLFRHSRATHVLAAGIMTDAQARQYFGWTPQSTMIGRYAHLVDTDAHNALLRENNLAPTKKKENVLQTTACTRCGSLNALETSHCTTCALPLNVSVAYNPPDTATLVLRLAKVLVEQGLLDRAADEVHDAQLGMALSQLRNACRTSNV